MSFSLSQVMTRADWTKMLILLVAAMAAWYYVLQEYTKPFNLPDDIRNQQMIEEYQVERSAPLFNQPPQ